MLGKNRAIVRPRELFMARNRGCGEETVEISVRLAEPTTSDIEDTATLLHAVDTFYHGDETPGLAAHLRFVEDEVLGPGSSTLVALARFGKRIAGGAFFAIIYPADPLKGGIFLKDLFVFQETREKKVGEALMRFLARFAVENDLCRIDWGAGKDLDRVRAFYDSLGAHVLDDRVLYRLEGNAMASLAGADPDKADG